MLEKQEWWRIAFFLALFFGLWVAVDREAVLDSPLAGLTEIWARATFDSIRALGLDAVRVGPVIRQPGGFAFELTYNCTGILPSLVVAVAILASRGSWSRKGVGIALAVLILAASNLVRLVHLFWSGVHDPDHFGLVHDLGWPAVTATLVVGSWFLWRRWMLRFAGAEGLQDRSLVGAQLGNEVVHPGV